MVHEEDVPDPPILKQAPAISALVEKLNAQIKQEPDNASPWKLKGILFQQLGATNEAMACLDRALARSPDDPDIFCHFGQMLIVGGLTDEAQKSFELALEKDDCHVEALIGMGLVSLEAGSLVDGLQYYDRAIEIDPKSGKAWYMKGLALDNDNTQEAKQRCFDQARTLGFEVPD